MHHTDVVYTVGQRSEVDTAHALSRKHPAAGQVVYLHQAHALALHAQQAVSGVGEKADGAALRAVDAHTLGKVGGQLHVLSHYQRAGVLLTAVAPAAEEVSLIGRGCDGHLRAVGILTAAVHRTPVGVVGRKRQGYIEGVEKGHQRGVVRHYEPARIVSHAVAPHHKTEALVGCGLDGGCAAVVAAGHRGYGGRAHGRVGSLDDDVVLERNLHKVVEIEPGYIIGRPATAGNVDHSGLRNIAERAHTQRRCDIAITIDGVKVLDDISFIVGREDKIAFVGSNEIAKTTLFRILSGEIEPDEGNYKWGVTTTQTYFPKDNTKEFDNDYTIVDWLTGYSEIKDATYVRGFLGRMLFAGDDGVKKVKVLSGGEKVRCLLSKMMISGANVLILDEPTNHLDMESITALNNGLIKFPGVILFASHDHQFVETTANRIMEIVNGKLIDKITTYDEYLASDEMARKRETYEMDEGENDN